MKYITMLLLCCILANCQIQPKQSDAAVNYISCGAHSDCVTIDYVKIRNMDYAILYMHHGGTTTINLTKDELEIAYLKKQLQ